MDWGAIQNLTLEGTIGNIITAILAIAGVIAVLFIIIAGVRLVTAAGNPDQLKQAKDMILYSVIGIVVIILSWAIIKFVIDALVKTP